MNLIDPLSNPSHPTATPTEKTEQPIKVVSLIVIILAVQTNGHLIAIQNMVISMISALAALTLAFMAFTASAQSVDPEDVKGVFFTFYYFNSPETPVCVEDEAIPGYSFDVGLLIRDPALGCQYLVLGTDSPGVGSFKMNGTDAALLSHLTCYVTGKEESCAAAVTHENRIASGSKATPTVGGNAGELSVCIRTTSFANGPFYGVSISCFIS